MNFDNTINYSNGVKIPFNETKFRNAYKNNTLICVEGGSAGRKVAKLSEDVCFGNKLATINSWIVNSEYIYLVFQSNIIQNFFKSNMTGIIGGVSLNKLKTFLIPIPPLKEQERIVNKYKLFIPLLSNYNNKYCKIEKLNINYKEDLNKSILQYAIQGKLVKQDSNDESAEVLIDKILDEKRELIRTKKIKKENLSVIYKDSTDNQFYEKFDDGTINNITDEIPFDIPANWCWTRLNNIVKSINAGGDKPKIFSKNITERNIIPVISNGEKNEGIFGFTDKPVICEESLTISGRGTIGYSKIRTIPYVPIVRLLVLIPLTNTNLEYLQLSIQALIEKGVGTAVKQLTVPMIKPKLIPIPPLSEQMKILNIFNKFIHIIEK